jgi:iron-sulfur cluster assembly protein
MRYDPEKQTSDKVFEEYGARGFVDLKSYLYLRGMTLDWQEQLMQQGFTFANPNATSTCSCGLSFGI